MERLISKERLEIISGIVAENSRKMNKSFADENEVIAIYCQDPGMQLRVCAERCNNVFGTSYNGDDIVNIFGGMYMNNPSFRKAVFYDANDAAALVLDALRGDSEKCDEIERRMNENNGRIIKTKSRQFERIALISMFEAAPELAALPCHDMVFELNRGYAKDTFNAIADVIKLDKRKRDIVKKQYASSEEYEQEIIRLETILNRKELMLERLQNEFDSRLEECRAEESIKLISVLNSPKYGHILDLMLRAQRGISAMRREKRTLPIEIKSLPILVRRIFQFVGDCGIMPMLEVGSVIKVKADEIDGYNYEGSPFTDDDDVKTAEVISPGWIMGDMQIVISNPGLKEVED